MTERVPFPDVLLEFFNGRAVEEKQGLASLLVSADAEGWPHVTLLSVGEVLVPDREHVRIAIWSTSSVARDVRATRKALLETVLHERVFKVELTIERLHRHRAAPPAGKELLFLDAGVRRVREDSVAYARVTRGHEYELVDADTVVPRWNSVLTSLRDWCPEAELRHDHGPHGGSA